MSATAAKVLHLAIEDAVEQLEPQLLPLFGAGRAARDPVVRPTLRTQVALKMLVALTRFFPEEHRVCQAGRQLEQIWPPLVHEPRGAAASKLLHYYFRLRQDLLVTPDLALLRGMRDLVRNAIEEAEVSGSERLLAACEKRLRSLASFLPAPPLDVESLVDMTPLARLFVWQQGLELVGEQAGSDELNPLLLPDMLAVLDRCTALSRSSDGSLEYFCNTGLARALWHLRGMAGVGGSDTQAELFAELEDECLDMHLAGSKPHTALMQRWLARLFELVHDGSSARMRQAHGAEEPDFLFRSAYDQELARYQRQLQIELQAELSDETRDPATLKVRAPLITLLYKLTWVFAAAGQRDWARFCHCAYRIALQFWRIRRPVTSSCHTVLLNLARDMGSPVSGVVLRQWRRQLLQDWPNWTDDTKRPIALRPEAGDVVALEAVPDLLSGSFTALVQAGRLTELPSAEACRPFFQVLMQDMASELLQELVLLEKGAAAMKVWPLEQLCTLLIAVYEAHLRDEAELPAALLQDAHRQLVRMLDQAAAWREVQIAEGLVQALETWLKHSLQRQSVCREPLAGVDAVTRGETGSGFNGQLSGEEPLRTHLLSCLGTLAPVLERPVRLQLDAGGIQLDAARLTQVIDCLRPLLKFMLLDQTVDAYSRHAMHKPRASTLMVTLRATSATLVITVGEDSHEEVLAPAELQRLQRRLPKGTGPLACESRAGHGRSFTFTLN
jgi:hypothetical protein